MKKFISILLVAGALTGCAALKSFLGTSPITAIGKTESITITVVKGAMQAWGDHVRAGNATQAQVDAVKAAYLQYYHAQLQASNAIVQYYAVLASTNGTADTKAETGMNAALAQADASKSNLLTTINTLLK